MSNKTNHLYWFDEYVLNAEEGNLWHDDELISLPPKVFETLRLLVENGGEILTKDEMMNAIWADAFVEESNLSQNIYMLRQIFGREKKFIETVPKTGYRFVEPVRRSLLADGASARGTDASHRAGPAERAETGQIGDEPGKAIGALKPNFWLAALVLVTAAVITVSAYFYLSGTAEKNPVSVGVELKHLTDTGNANFPAISPDGKFVAYVKHLKGEVSLRLKDIVSGSEVAPEIDGIKPGFLQFSPDGLWLYFRPESLFVEPTKVYRVSYFGGKPEAVAEDVWSNFGFSPGGEKITFVRRQIERNEHELIVKDLATGAERVVAARRPPRRFVLRSFPVFSPDSRKIAIPVQVKTNADSHLAVFDLETGTEEIISPPDLQIRQALWAPGTTDLLLAARRQHAKPQIWRMSYPGGKPRRVTNDLNAYRGLSVSADGRRLVTRQFGITSNIWFLPAADSRRAAQLTRGSYGNDGLFGLNLLSDGTIIYTSRTETDRGLWAVSARGGAKRPITETDDEINERAAVSPDEKHIYFNSSRTGTTKIWRAETDGTNPVQMTFGADESDFSPVVSPDNRWLYFIRRGKKELSIRRKSLVNGVLEQIPRPKELPPEGFLGLSPDGKYLAYRCLRKVEGGEDGEQETRAAFVLIDLQENSEPRLIETFATRPFLRWTNDGQTFDYAENTPEGGKIWRQNLAENAAPEIILDLPRERIYFFDWSPDERDLVVARGNHHNDVVLIEFSR